MKDLSLTMQKLWPIDVKVFVDKQMDRWTNGQAKNYMPLISRCGGIKRRKSAFSTQCFEKVFPQVCLNIFIIVWYLGDISYKTF